MRKASNAFNFVTQIDLVEVTGAKARTLPELLEHLKNASGAVLYYHTHHFLKQHQFLSPEPPNDFAYWVGQVLQENRLGEQLASIDTVRFPSIMALGERISDVIAKHIATAKSTRIAPEGEEFHFMKSQSFVIPTPHHATDLKEFLASIKKVSVRSLYHHIFQARLRLGKPTNDFSHWFDTELEEHALAKSIGRLDPYTQTLEDLRAQIIGLIETRIKKLEAEPVHAA